MRLIWLCSLYFYKLGAKLEFTFKRIGIFWIISLRQTRAIAIDTACRYGHQDCIENASTYFKNWMLLPDNWTWVAVICLVGLLAIRRIRHQLPVLVHLFAARWTYAYFIFNNVKWSYILLVADTNLPLQKNVEISLVKGGGSIVFSPIRFTSFRGASRHTGASQADGYWHYPAEWRLFTDSIKGRLKAVLLP